MCRVRCAVRQELTCTAAAGWQRTLQRRHARDAGKQAAPARWLRRAVRRLATPAVRVPRGDGVAAVAAGGHAERRRRRLQVALPRPAHRAPKRAHRLRRRPHGQRVALAAIAAEAGASRPRHNLCSLSLACSHSHSFGNGARTCQRSSTSPAPGGRPGPSAADGMTSKSRWIRPGRGSVHAAARRRRRRR